jgi:YVTN family beta-propeller protein
VLRALVLCALAPLVVAGAASATSSGGTPGAFVTVEGASQIVGVDLTTGRIVARIRVPKGPRQIVRLQSPHEQLLVVSPRAGAVSLVDVQARRVVEIWRGFGRPSDVAVEGEYAYVTDEERNLLTVIDLSTRKVVGRADVGPRPRSVAVGDLALVAHGRAQAEVSVVDIHRPRAPRRIERLPVPGPAFDISKQPDSNLAYLANGDRGGVGAIRTTGRIWWWRPVGAFTHSVQFDYYHGRRLWVSDRDEGTVLALASHRNGRVLRRLTGCAGARGVMMVGTAWVVAACPGANALGYWSQLTWKRKLVRVGRGANGVAEVVLP